MIRTVLMFDVDQIQEYVFATGRLREVRGASEIVRVATEEADLMKTLRKDKGLPLRSLGAADTEAVGEIVYAAGGTGVLLVDDPKQVGRVDEALHAHYAEQTKGGTLTTGRARWNPDDPPVDGWTSFQLAMRRAQAELQRRKATRGRPTVLAVGGALAYCASCRARPPAAQERQPDNPDAPRLLCHSCLAKHEFSHRVRETTRRRLFWRAFIDGITDPRARRAWEATLEAEPGDFPQIGRRAHPHGYIGFCYADGDAVGAALEDIPSPEAYRSLSQALRMATHQALGEALRMVFAQAPGAGDAAAPRWILPSEYRVREDPAKESILPFEVLMVGGDDVMLVTTAESALPVMMAYCEAFARHMKIWVEQQSDPHLRNLPPFSASGGVVIAHDSMPVLVLRERSGDLQKSAKQTRRQAGWQEGALDFHIATTPTLEHIRQIREEYSVYDPGSHGRIALIRRPYRVSQLGFLWVRAQEVRRHIPGSKRADLYRAMFQPPWRAVWDLLQIQSRLRGEGRRALLEAATEFQWSQEYPYGPPPAGSGRARASGLVDLLELAELVPTPEAP